MRHFQTACIATVLFCTPFLDGGRQYQSLFFVHLVLWLSLLVLALRNRVLEGARSLPATALGLVCAHLFFVLLAGLLAPYRYGALLRVLDLFAAVAFGLLYLSYLRGQPAAAFKLLFVALSSLSVLQAFYLFAVRAGFSIPDFEPLFFRNLNYSGVYMAAGAMLALGYALEERPFPSRLGFVFMFLICAGGIVLTASRTAILALFVASHIPLWKKKRVLAFVPVLLFLLLFLVPNPFRERIRHLSSDIYAWKRTEIWRIDARIWEDHRPLGIGPGQFVYYSPAYNFPVAGVVGRYRKVAELPHSAFLGALLEGGPVSFLAFCGLCFLVLYSGWRRGRASSPGRREGRLAAPPFLVIVLAGLFSDPLEVPALLYLFTALGGAVLSRIEGTPSSSPSLTSRPGRFLLLFLFSFAGVRFIALPFWAHRDFRNADRLRGQDESEAIERLTSRAVFLDRGNPLYHEFLGRFRAARLAGDKDPAGYYAARKELEEAARLNPRETDFLTPLIELEETMGFPGARRRVGRLFERAESLSPFNPFFPFEHALLVLSEGDLERASSLMDRAASVEPQFVRAHYFLFKIALSRGEWERVREEACRAVDISESRRGYKTDSLYEAQLLSVPPEELAELRRFWESHGKPGRSGGDAGIERKDVE